MSPFTRQLLRIVRGFGAFERESVCCGTVTVPQCLVLQLLLDGAYPISDLAGLAGASPSAMTRLVDGLVKRGYARRVRAEEDRRRVLVELTDAGRTEATRLRDLTDEGVQQVLRFVPEGRRQQVVEALELVAAAMEKASKLGLACCAPPP